MISSFNTFLRLIPANIVHQFASFLAPVPSEHKATNSSLWLLKSLNSFSFLILRSMLVGIFLKMFPGVCVQPYAGHVHLGAAFLGHECTHLQGDYAEPTVFQGGCLNLHSPHAEYKNPWCSISLPNICYCLLIFASLVGVVAVVYYFILISISLKIMRLWVFTFPYENACFLFCKMPNMFIFLPNFPLKYLFLIISVFFI